MTAEGIAVVPKQEIRTEDGRVEEVWSLPKDEAFLESMFSELFGHHYDKLSFGPLIPGAAYELRCPGKPNSITMLDGYLTVHWGAGGHFHLCLGETKGLGDTKNSADFIAHRRPGRVELYRRLDKNGLPVSWGIRMFNGHDEPQISIFLPNPYITPDDKVTSEPDWSRLKLWEDLLPRFTGNAPDGRDYLSKGFGSI